MSAPETGSAKCPDCDGKGTLDGKTACDRCKGWGQIITYISPSGVPLYDWRAVGESLDLARLISEDNRGHSVKA